MLMTGEPLKQAEDREKPNPTLAPAWQNTYQLKDTGLFRVSLGMLLPPSLGSLCLEGVHLVHLRELFSFQFVQEQNLQDSRAGPTQRLGAK